MRATANRAVLVDRPMRIAEDHYLLAFTMADAIARPGQFVNIRVGDSTDPLLRRPFSVFDQDRDTLKIVIRVVGKGTAILADARPGTLDVIGPVGNGFTLSRGKRVLCAGGGVGNAPLYALARALKDMDNEVYFVYGARSSRFVYCLDDFRNASHRLFLVTDDGSEGEKATTGEMVSRIAAKEPFDTIYTCGPTGMMRAVTEYANGANVEVSVENYFGCGIGLCAGCTVRTLDGNRRACVDGPVFDGKRMLWDEQGT